MQTKWSWFERHFDFNFPAEKMPDIIERLRGATIRARDLSQTLEESVLHFRESETSWSVLENIAHIPDLEPLWIGRIEDILDGHETMRAADLTNSTTFKANHHLKSIEEVLDQFKKNRDQLLNVLLDLKPEQWTLDSKHPRLKTSMRICDLGLFVAEHDDYHLSRARYLTECYENLV